jgi:hypothetical protein
MSNVDVTVVRLGVPGGSPAIAGIETMWTFFAAHPLPGPATNGRVVGRR